MDEELNTEELNTGEERNVPRGRSRKGLVIVLIAALVIVTGGLSLWFFVFRGTDTPESLAQEVIDASLAKDWKRIIDKTPDEVLEVLMSAGAGEMQKRNLTTVNELRSWALEHAASITDPMNGKKILKAEVGEVHKMSTETYIENSFLGGRTDDVAYPFLKSKDEIAVVEISYVVEDGPKTSDRKDTVLTYRQGGKWFLVTGMQVVLIELQTIE